MTILTNSSYFTPEAARDYWSVSQFKTFDRCEACGLASLNGEYKAETSTALLVGSYVDAYFTGDKGTLAKFAIDHPEIFKKDGSLESEFRQAETMIEAVKRQDLAMEYLRGETQVIMSAELFDVPWKIKIDVHGGNRIVDLKTVKDFKPLYKEGFGWMDWVSYWGYDIQGAVYQQIEKLYSGRLEPLPFYIVAVTKEKVPDVKVIHIPQYMLDTALKVVESKIDRLDLVKHGEIEPERCEVCDYCKQTKVLTEPEEYEAEEV